MKFIKAISLFCLGAVAAIAQVNVQKQQGTNALTNGSIVVPSGVSITATGNGQIIATNTAGQTSGNSILAGNNNGGFQNVTIGTGLAFTNNVLSNTQTSAQWGNITGNIQSQTDLQSEFATKAPATTGNAILSGNNAGGFSNVVIGSGLTYTGNTLTATGTGGTVTSFSVTTNNGVVASVINPTTTPVLNISLTGNLGSAAFTSTNAYDPAGAAAAAQAYAIQRANQTGTQPASTITGLATVATTGNYYDLTNRPTLNAGTVTSVGGTGSVNGITLSGTVTTSGNLTLGGSLSGITNSQLTNNSITITAGSGLSGGGNAQLGSSVTLSNAGVTSIVAGSNITVNSATGSVQISASNSGGTVTSVAVTGQNGIGSVVTNPTTTPSITLNLGNITPLSDTSVFNGSIGQTTPNAGAFNSLKTTTLTGYLYGNSTNNVTASTTIPTTALSGTITNAQLTNNSITIAGTSTALGGSISQDTITGLSSTGIVKRTAANTLATAVSGTDYAPATSGTSILYGNGLGGFSPVTVGSGLSFSGGTLSSTAGSGSVTSVGLSAPSGFTVSGSPVTGAGTLTFSTVLNGYLSGNGANGITASSTIPTSALSGTIPASSITGLATVATTGNYYSLTNLPTLNAGTVTSVSGTGTVQGITLSGSVTSSGSLTLGGSLSPINLGTQVTGTLNVASGGTGVTTSTGSGSVVLSNSPTLVTPNLGQPTYADLTNATRLPLSSGVTGILTVANGGTGTSTPSLVAGNGISVANGFPNQTITNTGVTNIVAGSNVTINSSTGSVQISATNSGGTVTSISTNNGAGVITNVSNPTTTPNISISLANIPNTALANNSITVTAGTGLSGGGTVALGGNTTLSNAGVVNLTAGSGVTLNSSTGSVQISATGTGGTVTSIDVNGDATGLTFTGGPVTTTGNITMRGVLNTSNGGTGSAAGLTGYVYGNNSSPMTASTTIPGTAITGNIAGNAANVTGTVAIANGGTGTATPATVAGTGISVSGSFPNETITNAGVTNLIAGTGVTLNASSGSVQISATGTGGTVTSVSGTGTVQGISLSGTVTTNGNLTLGGSLSPINLASQVTGTLPVANGGTGVTTSSGANSVVLRDSNSNVSANNFYSGFSNQAASGTTIVLTALSVPNYAISGSGGQVIKLPDATTLPNGTLFSFNNNQSSGTITVQNNSGTTVCTTQSGAYIYLVLLNNGSAAGTWDYHNVAPFNASWSTNTLSWAGTYTNGTWNGNAIGALYGGTGTTGLTGYVYGNGTSAMTASTTIPTSALSGTISNAQLANSAITIAGTSTSLGGTISQDTITGLSTTGLVKRTGANTLAIAASGTDYAPATSGSSILYGNGAGGFSNVTIGTGVSFSGGTLSATGTGGTVTSFSSGSLSPLFTTSVATSTSTPALSFSLSNAAANTILGNNTSSSAAPAYNTVSSYLDNAFSSTQGAILYRSGSAWVALPAGTSGQLLTTGGAGANPSWTTYTGSSSITTVGTLTSGAIGTGFTAIPNSALANNSITFGSTSQALGSTISAINGVSIGGSSAAAGTFTSLTATGTTTLATSLTGALSASSGVVSAGTLSIANGGTGQTTAAAAQRALTPATSTVTSGASPSVNWSLSNSFDLTLTSATAASMAFTNAQDGQVITIAIHQPASGTPTTVSWSGITGILWAGGTAPTQTATLGKTDVYTFYYNATAAKYYGSYVQNF